MSARRSAIAVASAAPRAANASSMIRCAAALPFALEGFERAMATLEAFDELEELP